MKNIIRFCNFYLVVFVEIEHKNLDHEIMVTLKKCSQSRWDPSWGQDICKCTKSLVWVVVGGGGGGGGNDKIIRTL